MNDTIARSAQITGDGLYRHQLWRRWGDGPEMAFIMLNPSTADDMIDDPTIRRCMGFARRENCGSVSVVNLFSLRATNPKELIHAADPVGGFNRSAIYATLRLADIVVAAWGAHLPQMVAAQVKQLPEIPLLCLGVTKSGAPRHPLYLPADTPLVPWPIQPKE